MKLRFICLAASLFYFSCSSPVYKSPEFAAALKKHKLVAILPVEVTMKLRPNEIKNMTIEQQEENVKQTGYELQDKIYGWLLRKEPKYKYTVSFQDISKTNSLLENAGMKYADLKFKDRAAIAKILGVDAVLQGKVNMEKPMSEGVAMASHVLVGGWSTTNKVHASIDIHDGESGNLLWKIDYKASGSVGSSSSDLADGLMEFASGNFPYKNSRK